MRRVPWYPAAIVVAGAALPSMRALSADQPSPASDFWEEAPLLDIDDECTGDDVDQQSCTLNAVQLRASNLKGIRAVAGSAAGEQASTPNEPTVPGPIPEVLLQGRRPPMACILKPWSCGPDDWGWDESPLDNPRTTGWSAWHMPWSSWTPAPSAAKPPEQSSGLCAVMPYFCPSPTPAPPPTPPSRTTPPPPPESLEHRSGAPLLTFYIYRVQNDENYPQPNHDMLNIPGGLWYLHNEVVWHENGRSGTYFSHPVTRIIKFKIQTRATQPLWDMQMNFGVFNAFDSGQCTGPFQCDNFAKVGFVVGCETWREGDGSNFPHTQWNQLNHYKRATWYSLPGPCPSQPFKSKTEKCNREAPGGLCPPGVRPTGEYNCTYQLEQLGELSIDEIVGIGNYDQFVKAGGREYDPTTDKGVHTSFWDGIKDEAKCNQRIERVKQLFRQKYPHHPDLPDPPCDFDKFIFYPDRKT